MSEEIKVGDIVECLDARPHFAMPPWYYAGLAKGRLYRVAAIETDDLGHQRLNLQELGRAFFRVRFRLVPPATDEFARLVRACRPMPAPDRHPVHALEGSQ